MNLINIPNTLTCCNLICGCMAAGAAFYGNYQYAVLMIILGAVFDFFDGMVAWALGVSSPVGKELESCLGCPCIVCVLQKLIDEVRLFGVLVDDAVLDALVRPLFEYLCGLLSIFLQGLEESYRLFVRH